MIEEFANDVLDKSNGGMDFLDDVVGIVKDVVVAVVTVPLKVAAKIVTAPIKAVGKFISWLF